MQVEAVAWTSGMKDLLYAALSLAALVLYVRAVQEKPRNPLRCAVYWLGAACVVVGMLCKPTAMVTPMVATVLDRMILGRRWRDVARSIWPWFIAIVPLAVVAKIVQSGQEVMSPPVWERPVVAGASLAFYLGKLVAPVRFTFDYGWEPVVMLRKGWFWGIAVIPVVLAGVLWWRRRRWAWPPASGMVSVVALLPVLGLVPFQFQKSSTVADHYAYLAMLGPAMVAAWGLSRLSVQHWRAAVGVWVMILVTLGALSIHQLGYWRTEVSILERNLELTPHKSIGHNALGILYQMRNDYPRAEAAFRQAIALDSDFVSPRVSLGNIHSFQGRTDDAIPQIEALIDLQRRLPPDQRQDMSGTLMEGARLMMARQQFGDAIKYLEADLRHRPGNSDAIAVLNEARRKLTTKPATTRAAADRLGP
jgi:hypothetical protein